MIAAAVLLIWVNWGTTRSSVQRKSLGLPQEPISLEGAAVRGAPEANTVVVAFTDFQCPFCRRFSLEMLPILDREYISTGKVRFAVRHLPLTQLHPEALSAAVGAECAHRQGKFWPFHDELFASSSRLDTLLVRESALRVGAESTAWDACIASAEARDTVQRDVALAAQLKVGVTPTFLLGSLRPDGRVRVTHVLVGPRNIDVFRDPIDSIIRSVQ